ncbi:ferredoxin reductase [Salinisphaera sp. T31B1]|uniref:ferredoxin reductase n=1 Tax=Salinisphaera sp. T31B1 TaxID=727963 RepID=UPI00333E18C8
MSTVVCPRPAGFIRGPIVNMLRSRLGRTLTYPHGPDRFIELFDRTAVADETVGMVTRVTHPTPRSVRLAVRPNARWQGFRAGQYVELAVEIDGRRERRMFSPAQSQHAGDELEFTMAVQPDGRLTRHIKNNARAGDRVILGAAAGTFHLPDARPQRLVLISAGSGITPVLSMLRTLIDERHAGRIDFIHYARSPDEELYAEALDTLSTALPGLHIHRFHTRGGGAHFTGAQLDALVPDHAQAETFVCGPQPLLEATRAHFGMRGIGERLHQEAFGPAAADPPGNAANGDIRFAHSAQSVANDGRTLLEQAEAAGLSPTHGCRMGVCYACTCRKTSGRVRDLRTGEVGPDGDAEIQICVSVPAGPVALDL